MKPSFRAKKSLGALQLPYQRPLLSILLTIMLAYNVIGRGPGHKISPTCSRSSLPSTRLATNSPSYRPSLLPFPPTNPPPNPLPIRSLPPTSRRRHTLYIHTSLTSYGSRIPSFNPTCLKWQAYLRFQYIPFDVAPSNNHASPSGALPFLLPAPASTSDARLQGNAPSPPITPTRLVDWTRRQRKEKGTAGPSRPKDEALRCEAYLSLLEKCVRLAWVCV